MRRSRIRAIANIPVRKKALPPDKIEGDMKNQSEILESVNGSEEDNSKTGQLTFKPEKLETEKTVLNEMTQVNNSDSDKISIDPMNSVVAEINEPTITVNKKDISVLGNVLLNSESNISDSNSVKIQEDSTVCLTKNHCNESENKPTSVRRRPIKPSINFDAIRRRDLKPVPNNENVDSEQITNYQDAAEVKEDKHETELTEQKVENVVSEAVNVEKSNCAYSNNQVVSTELRTLKSPSHNLTDIRKTSTEHENAGSDCEYPPPPPSPNKLNRSRIKAIPKIAKRKISFSASESEDESKKLDHRVRHDSQSSNFSGAHESVTEQPSTPKVMEYSSVIQKKCKRTEWSRKLTEARREFTRKFVTGKPDHKKLTMIDLIFYNPTTNAMKNERRTISEAGTKSEPKNEEEVDNPSGSEDDPTNKDDEASKKSDEDNEIPAPQIKIGPSGEIILDEQSLVIENKETKRKREQIERSKLIDGDIDRPYGVYKKVKRSKDWTHSETLRFYKALSTIGTDFTLMCELFPNRTRRELKMKFKKEEKINQALIDKAVMEPCSFDFEELKKEFELVEIERKELEKQRMKEEKLKKTKGVKKSIKFLKFTQENDINQNKSSSGDVRIESDISDGDIHQEIQKNGTKLRNKQIKRKIPNHMKKGRQKNFDIMGVLTDSDSGSDGSGESEVIWKPVKTRYGRKTRKRQIYEPEANIQEDVIVSRKIHKPNLDNQEEPQKPGSLMMISSKAPDGQPVVQIFMVTDKRVQNDNNIQGVEDVNTENLLPIAMIKTGQTDDEEEEIVENNYTIPAEPENHNLAQMVNSIEVGVVENVENEIDDSSQT